MLDGRPERSGPGEGGGQPDQRPPPTAGAGRRAGLDGRPRRALAGGGAGRARSLLGGRDPGNGAPGHDPGNRCRRRLRLVGGGAEGGGGGGEDGQLAAAVVTAGQVVADHGDLGPVELPEQQPGQLVIRVLAHPRLIPITCPIRRSPLNIRAFTVPSGTPS